MIDEVQEARDLLRDATESLLVAMRGGKPVHVSLAQAAWDKAVDDLIDAAKAEAILRTL